MTSQSLLLSLAILSSSFLGSWHCLGMCGPIATLAARRKSLWSYNLGRGISYTTIGALGGYLGSFFLQSQFVKIRIFSSVIFALILLGMGANQLLSNRPLQFKNPLGLNRYFSNSQSGAVLGLLSVFLPCGWLYSYVMAAVASQSAYAGFFVMLLFWLGGLPALSAVSLFVKKSIELSSKKKQVISGLVLVAAGLYSLVSFYIAH